MMKHIICFINNLIIYLYSKIMENCHNKLNAKNFMILINFQNEIIK